MGLNAQKAGSCAIEVHGHILNFWSEAFKCGMTNNLNEDCSDFSNDKSLLLELEPLRVACIFFFLAALLIPLFHQSGRSRTALSIIIFLKSLHLCKWVSTDSVL